MLASALTFSVMSLLVKASGRSGIGAGQIVWARALVALVLSVVMMRRAHLRPFHDQPVRLLMQRGVLGFIALTCFFYALTQLPLGDATVIQYTNPVFVALMAAMWLKEAISRAHLVSLACCLAGVLLVAQPEVLFGGEARLPLGPVLLCLAGALFSAGAYTTVRALSGKSDPLVVVFYFPIVALPLSLPLAWRDWVWPDLRQSLLLLGVGVCAQIAQIFMTRALHLERAGRITAISYMQVVFAFGWGMLLFSERPGLLAIGGAALVVGGSLMAARAR